MKIIFSLVVLSILFLVGCSQSSDEVSTPQDVDDQTVAPEEYVSAVSHQFENDDLSFALYYEYDLEVKEGSENQVEIFEQGDPTSLARVEWYTDGEKDYFNHLSSLSQGGNWFPYEFPEADSALRSVLDVKMLNGKTYAITWKENVGHDFVIVNFDDANTKSLRVANAILQTVSMK